MTVKLEDIYADPHVLDAPLSAGEIVVLEQSGKVIARLVPEPAGAPAPSSTPQVVEKMKARFLATWGANAFQSSTSVQEIMDRVREPERP